MNISVGAGTYVVGVSGGVDSMVLLDLLRQRPGIKLVVAHFDHGIRADSAKDRRLVAKVAARHGLPFVYAEGHLGSNTSEAKARAARYKFLHDTRVASGAKAIITAHHQDDFLETAVFNVLRGTGRRGLSPFKNNTPIIRPLLEYDKQYIRDYADIHSLHWREDPTNSDTKYTRNYIRSCLMPNFSAAKKAELLILLGRVADISQEIDSHITGMLHVQPALDILDRNWLIGLPHSVSSEVVHSWLTRHKIKNITKKMVERLVIASKTGRAGQKIDIGAGCVLLIKGRVLALGSVEC